LPLTIPVGAFVDALTRITSPHDRSVQCFDHDSAERIPLETELRQLRSETRELPVIISDKASMASVESFKVVDPHMLRQVLGRGAEAAADDVRSAVEAANSSALPWRALPFEERAALFLRPAEPLAEDWRCISNAATMLGQSTSVQQAAVEAPCELIEFSCFNLAHAKDLLAPQRTAPPGTWNQLDHRPLDGFVLAGLLTQQRLPDRTP
jgi:1-pyrroline-5-carboxylate dehydrogenase